LPVPVIIGVHVDVCVVRMDAGEQLTVTDVIVGETGGVLPPPPPLLPPQPATTAKMHAASDRAKTLRPIQKQL
jgi:hypothetical protein